MKNIAIEAQNRLIARSDAALISREEALSTVNVPLYINWLKKRKCHARAAAVPLPGPTLGSFMDKSIQVFDVQVNRLLPAHVIVLQRCENKILGLISADKAEREEAVSLSTEEDADLALIFTEPVEKVFELASTGGKDAIREQSKKFLMEWPQEKLRGVCLAVMEQFKRYAEAQVKLVSEMREKGDLTFFQEPEKAPATKTDAAGS